MRFKETSVVEVVEVESKDLVLSTMEAEVD